MTFYTHQEVPDGILIITGAFALTQVVMSLWALSDKWEEKSKLNETTLVQFSALRSTLRTLRPRSDGLYDESTLQRIDGQSSSVGLNYDDKLGVSDRERRAAWAAAVRRFRDPPRGP